MPSVSPKPTHANPTIYSLTTNTTTANSDAYILRVSSDSTTNVLTIASNKSHLVQNEGSNSFVLATTGNSNLTINAGGQARATWSSSTSQHELQDDQISVTVDTAMSDSSTNPVRNSVIKTYVDSATGSTTNLTWTASTRTMASSSGNNAVITEVDSSNSGLMTSGDKTKVDYIAVTSSVDLDTLGTTNLTYDNSSRQVQSSTGTNATIDLASSSVDGLMASGDKTKVDYIAVTSSVDLDSVLTSLSGSMSGAIDVNGNEITGAIDLHSTGNVVLELGDAAGTNKVSVRDSGANEVATIDSEGTILAEQICVESETEYNLGTISSGTITLSPANGLYQNSTSVTGSCSIDASAVTLNKPIRLVLSTLGSQVISIASSSFVFLDGDTTKTPASSKAAIFIFFKTGSTVFCDFVEQT